MLKHVTIDTKPDGKPITIPASINEANLEQQVKRFIEITDGSPFDGQERAAILPFFAYQLERHKHLANTNFPLAGSLPKLPL
jgi:hypothetical protein